MNALGRLRVVALWMVFLSSLGLMLGPGSAFGETAGQGDDTTAGIYFCKYKPNYFILGVAENGDEKPTTKFQFSFRYVLWDSHVHKDDVEKEHAAEQTNRCASPPSRHVVNFGYSQKSIWKLYEESAPFDENNYNPEVYYSYNTSKWLGWGAMDWVTLGIEHESNGEGGSTSRSWKWGVPESALHLEGCLRRRVGGGGLA